MSSDPVDDQDHDGKRISSHHNTEFSNAVSTTSAEANKYSEETEKTNDTLLERASEVGYEKNQHQVKMLEKKLSATLLNLTAKEEIVKQHEKVAVEAVAGWEKAETEVDLLKQQLEAASGERSSVEHRANHLDEALKECVRQLEQARAEQEQNIKDAVLQKTMEWDSIRSNLENQLLQLEVAVQSSKADFDMYCKLQYLERQNLALEHDLISQSEELEIRTIERDLTAHAAETASKQQLDIIRKLAKLEAENRNLRSIAQRCSAVDHKSVSVSSMYFESLTDSQSDCGEQMNAVEMDSIHISNVGFNEHECEPSCSDSWTSTTFAEVDTIKKQKANIHLTESTTEIDLMDDFLEMEHFAALPVIKRPTVSSQKVCEESFPRAKDLLQPKYELQEKIEKIEVEKSLLDNLLEKMTEKCSALEERVRNMEKLNDAVEENKRKMEVRNIELIDKLKRMEEEKAQTDTNLIEHLQSNEILKMQLKENEKKLETMAAKVDVMQEEVTVANAQSNKFKVKCANLEDALLRKKQEVEIELSARLNAELKMKQEDLAVAALKLADCQHTIMSLGNQLKSLATLEDFLGDRAHLSQLTIGGSLIPGPGGDIWKMHSNGAFLAKRGGSPSNIQAKESNDHAVSCSSSELISKDYMNDLNGETGHVNVLPNSVEDHVLSLGSVV